MYIMSNIKCAKCNIIINLLYLGEFSIYILVFLLMF